MLAYRITLGWASLLLVFDSVPLAAQSTTNVLTWHNNNGRIGWNAQEKTLTAANVTKNTFGKLCSVATEGQIYAQPLIVTGVPFTEGTTTSTHDVAYVVTMKDNVYAFDANTCAPLKSVSLIPAIPGCVPETTCEKAAGCHYIGTGGCLAIAPTVGILGTPVIDAAVGASGTTGTMYVVAETQVGSGTSISAWYHRLHALNITNLSEKPGSPVIIQGNYPPAKFVSKTHIQRPGLLLMKNASPGGHPMVYVAFSLMDGSQEVGGLPSGWIFGYDTTNLSSQPAGLPYIFDTTPQGAPPGGPGGGIWEGGAGLAAGVASATDPTRYIYVVTGDGTFDANTGGQDYGDSFVKLTLDLKTIPGPGGYFTRFNEFTQPFDKDYGSGGLLLIPDKTFKNHPYIAVNASKDRNIYVVDRGTPGGYDGVSNTNLQTVTGPYPFHNAPAYWSGHLYYTSIGGALKSYGMNNSCTPGPICTGRHFSNIQFPYGATPSGSSNGVLPGTGVVWTIAAAQQAQGGTPAVLYAFDAITLVELYDSSQCGTQDTAGLGVKFTVPTVANGKVYVGTQGELDVYGNLSPPRTCP
jgi:hypothetical protein